MGDYGAFRVDNSILTKQSSSVGPGDDEAFSSSFDSAKWINDALAGVVDDDKIDSLLASTAMKLHIMSQDHTDSLESSMMEYIAMVPRTSKQLIEAEEAIEAIQYSIENVSSAAAGGDSKAAASAKSASTPTSSSNKGGAGSGVGSMPGIDDLHKLDVAKTNLDRCLSTLQEHAHWSQLVRDTSAFLESGGRLAEVADKLAAMYKSLTTLRALPGSTERHEQFKALREAVFSHLRPRVQNDVQNNDLTSLQEYFHIYERLGRTDELEEEYIGLRAKCLGHIWDSFPLRQQQQQQQEPAKGSNKSVTAPATATASTVAVVDHAKWVEWLARFDASMENLVQRTSDDLKVLFGGTSGAAAGKKADGSTAGAGAASDAVAENANAKTGHAGESATSASSPRAVAATRAAPVVVDEAMRQRHSTILCKIIALALQSFPQLLHNGLSLTKAAAQPPTTSQHHHQHQLQNQRPSLIFTAYQSITSTTKKHILPHLQFAPAEAAESAIKVLFGGCMGALSDFTDSEGSAVKQYLLQNVIKRMQFDQIVAFHQQGNGATAATTTPAGTGANTAVTVHIPDSVDVSEVLITFSEVAFDVTSERVVFPPLRSFLHRGMSYMGGMRSKTAVQTLATALVIFIQHFTSRIGIDLRSSFGMRVVDNGLSMNAGSDMSAGSVVSMKYAEKLAQKLHNAGGGSVAGSGSSGVGSGTSGGNNGTDGGGDGTVSLHSIESCSYLFIPAALKSLQAIGKLCRSVLLTEIVCYELSQKQLCSLLHATAEATGGVALAASASSADVDVVDMLIHRVFMNKNGEQSRAAEELRRFLESNSKLTSLKGAAATPPSLQPSGLQKQPQRRRHGSGSSGTHSVFASVHAALDKLKNSAGCLLVDLFTPTTSLLRPIAELHDDPVWCSGQRGGGGGSDSSGYHQQQQYYATPQHAFTLYGEHMLTVVHELENFVVGSSGNNCVQDVVFLSSGKVCRAVAARSWVVLGERVLASAASSTPTLSASTVATLAPVAAGVLCDRATCLLAIEQAVCMLSGSGATASAQTAGNAVGGAVASSIVSLAQSAGAFAAAEVEAGLVAQLYAADDDDDLTLVRAQEEGGSAAEGGTPSLRCLHGRYAPLIRSYLKAAVTAAGSGGAGVEGKAGSSLLSKLVSGGDCAVGVNATAKAARSGSIDATDAEPTSPSGAGAGGSTSTVELEEECGGAYVNAWLGCVSDGILGRLLLEVLSIPRLDASGLQQLKTDLIYTLNVANTLGLPPHPVLVFFTNVTTALTDAAEAEEARAGQGQGQGQDAAAVRGMVTADALQAMESIIIQYQQQTQQQQSRRHTGLGALAAVTASSTEEDEDDADVAAAVVLLSFMLHRLLSAVQKGHQHK